MVAVAWREGQSQRRKKAKGTAHQSNEYLGPLSVGVECAGTGDRPGVQEGQRESMSSEKTLRECGHSHEHIQRRTKARPEQSSRSYWQRFSQRFDSRDKRTARQGELDRAASAPENQSKFCSTLGNEIRYTEGKKDDLVLSILERKVVLSQWAQKRETDGSAALHRHLRDWMQQNVVQEGFPAEKTRAEPQGDRESSKRSRNINGRGASPAINTGRDGGTEEKQDDSAVWERGVISS
ncbi:hypothetical protein K438DRAFT_2150847 [Mycena galopus ATCC 62051]|nr:hypothetical protein K438DRAFT_2150847 [Mycena galopus ATCC 62051]